MVPICAFLCPACIPPSKNGSAILPRETISPRLPLNNMLVREFFFSRPRSEHMTQVRLWNDILSNLFTRIWNLSRVTQRSEMASTDLPDGILGTLYMSSWYPDLHKGLVLVLFKANVSEFSSILWATLSYQQIPLLLMSCTTTVYCLQPNHTNWSHWDTFLTEKHLLWNCYYLVAYERNQYKLPFICLSNACFIHILNNCENYCFYWSCPFKGRPLRYVLSLICIMLMN